MGRLIARFLEMAQVVLTSRRDLEQQVRDRTAELERLAKIDPLTELLNRRGMAERIRAATAQSFDPEINVCLSISVGGSLWAKGQELAGLLHDADQALYLAKEAGRNCCRILPESSINQ